MGNYNKEQQDLGKLAYLTCKDEKGVKRELFNSLCIEARCTILNIFLKKNCTKQLNSKNLDVLATSIFEKDIGQISLPERFKIIWNKDYINLKKS